MTLSTAVFNHLIQQNVEIREQLKQFAGRRAALVFPVVSVRAKLNGQGFLEDTAEEAETVLRFHDSALHKILTGGTPGVGDVSVEGDHGLGMALLPLLGALRYDMGSDAARLFGDAAGGAVERGWQALRQEGRATVQSVCAQIADYALENDAAIVGQNTFDLWAQDVGTVRSDTDRLEQRIRRIEQRLQK